MFSRLLKTVALVALIFAGGFVLYHRNEVKNPGDILTLFTRNLKIEMPSLGSFWSAPVDTAPVPKRPEDRIRIGSFKLNGSGLNPQNELIMDQVARLALEFDVLALQQPENEPGVIAEVVSAANRLGGNFKYLMDSRGDGYSILFDAERVQLDDNHYYSVHDPESLFERPPLVAWFRCRTANSLSAFTFSLVNYQQGPEKRESESEYFDSLFRAVREDGRGEDDVILVGDVSVSPEIFQTVQQRSGLFQTVSTSGQSSGPRAIENIICHQAATVELGQSGFFDYLRMFNLRAVDAQQVSLQNPVWAEFSVVEGERPSFQEQPNWNRPRPADPSFRPPAPPKNKTAEMPTWSQETNVNDIER